MFKGSQCCALVKLHNANFKIVWTKNSSSPRYIAPLREGPAGSRGGFSTILLPEGITKDALNTLVRGILNRPLNLRHFLNFNLNALTKMLTIFLLTRKP